MVSTAEVEFVNNCLRFVPVTLLIYDWALTFGDEVELIWNRRPKLNQLVFLALRYGTLGLMSLTVLYFVPVSEHSLWLEPLVVVLSNILRLRIQTWVSAAAMIVIILFVQVLLQIRVHALYNRSRVVLWSNAALFVVECAITVFLFLHLSERITPVPVTATQRCRTCSIYPRAFGLAYVAPLVYESYLMYLAARKSWTTRGSSHRLGGDSIIDVLARGSIQYFALVASGMAISMVLFLAAPRFALWVDFRSVAPPRMEFPRRSGLVPLPNDVPRARRPKPKIQRLPLDVLSQIFKAWQDQELLISSERPFRMPFYASSICGTWREAAIVTHELWTRPHLSGRRMLGSTAWLAYHGCFAERAGALGFDVVLTSDITNLPRWDAVWTQFREKILAKARVVNLYIPIPTADADILTGTAFPWLETLRIHYTGPPWGCDFAEIVLPRAAAMKHVALHNQPLLTIEVDDGREFNPLATITSLEVSRREYQVDQIRDLAEMAKAVTQFTLNAESLCDVEIQPFVWASVTVLHLTVTTLRGREHIPRRMSFPNVITLEVADVTANWPFWRNFIKISCPALTHLCIVGNETVTYGTAFMGAMGPLSQLTTLTFRGGSLSAVLVGGLETPRDRVEMPFSGLRSVHFENTGPIVGFLQDLVEAAKLTRRAFKRKQGMSDSFEVSCNAMLKTHGNVGNKDSASGERDVPSWTNPNLWFA